MRSKHAQTAAAWLSQKVGSSVGMVGVALGGCAVVGAVAAWKGLAAMFAALGNGLRATALAAAACPRNTGEAFRNCLMGMIRLLPQPDGGGGGPQYSQTASGQMQAGFDRGANRGKSTRSIGRP